MHLGHKTSLFIKSVLHACAGVTNEPSYIETMIMILTGQKYKTKQKNIAYNVQIYCIDENVEYVKCLGGLQSSLCPSFLTLNILGGGGWQIKLCDVKFSEKCAYSHCFNKINIPV